MTNIFELIYIAGIVTLAIIAGPIDPIKEPYRVQVCLAESSPNKEDVTTNIWSDQIEVYFKKYPGSHCGSCEASAKCPEEN